MEQVAQNINDKIIFFMEKIMAIKNNYTIQNSYNMQKLPTTKIAVGYSRVSTDKQVKEGHSIETQEQTIMEYCVRNKIRFSRFYTEEAKSGKNMERPKLQLMLAELQPGMVVIATAVSRISRSVKDLQTIIETIKSKGATLTLLDVNIETGTANGDLLFNITAAFSQFERQQTSERISTVLDHMSREGKLITKPRYGYKIIKEGKETKIVENDEEQQVIHKIREIIRLDPMITVSAIVRRLEIEGVKIRKAKKIYHTAITKIIEANELRKVPNDS